MMFLKRKGLKIGRRQISQEEQEVSYIWETQDFRATSSHHVPVVVNLSSVSFYVRKKSNISCPIFHSSFSENSLISRMEDFILHTLKTKVLVFNSLGILKLSSPVFRRHTVCVAKPLWSLFLCAVDLHCFPTTIKNTSVNPHCCTGWHVPSHSDWLRIIPLQVLYLLLLEWSLLKNDRVHRFFLNCGSFIQIECLWSMETEWS